MNNRYNELQGRYVKMMKEILRGPYNLPYKDVDFSERDRQALVTWMRTKLDMPAPPTEPCVCMLPETELRTGVPGILAQMKDGVITGGVECCIECERYDSPDEAFNALCQLGFPVRDNPDNVVAPEDIYGLLKSARILAFEVEESEKMKLNLLRSARHVQNRITELRVKFGIKSTSS